MLFFKKENFQNNWEFSQFKWSQQMMPPFLSINNKKKIPPPPPKKQVKPECLENKIGLIKKIL